MVKRRLDNFHVVCAKHPGHRQRPTAVDELPLEEDPEPEESHSESSSSEDDSKDVPACQASDDGADMEPDEDPVHVRSCPPLLGARCGCLPLVDGANVFIRAPPMFVLYLRKPGMLGDVCMRWVLYRCPRACG